MAVMTYCDGCGHRCKYPLILDQPHTRYLDKTRRDLPAGSKVCSSCSQAAVPAQQLHLFIKPHGGARVEV